MIERRDIMQDLSILMEQGLLNVRTSALVKCGEHYLIHKEVQDDFWCLVGGRVKFGEDSWSAVKREFLEELDYEIMQPQNLIFHVEQFFSHENTNYHELNYGYFIELDTQEIENQIRQEEGKTFIYEWKTAKEIQELTLYPESVAEMIHNQKFEFQHVV